jgi:hypothetical protein
MLLDPYTADLFGRRLIRASEAALQHDDAYVEVDEVNWKVTVTATQSYDVEDADPMAA